MMTYFETKWQAPSNIALIKYWGKHGNQLPNNPSLSVTLNKAVTTSAITFSELPNNVKTGSGISLDYYFDGNRIPAFENRIFGYLEKLLPALPVLSRYHITVNSSNTFPHSAGIASSASSMAALALGLCAADLHFRGETQLDPSFFQKASALARLGSGSAARSLFGGFVSWGYSEHLADSSDEHAAPLPFEPHPVFRKPGVAIMIASSARKSISSSLGHRLMEQHPFAEARYQQAHNHLAEILTALRTGDFEKFTHLTETEALTLHSLLMTSAPEGLLLKPASLQIIETVRRFRMESGVPVTFTLDAGPNVLLIYPEEYRNSVLPFIEEQLVPLCENGSWMDDRMGDGPQKCVHP